MRTVIGTLAVVLLAGCASANLEQSRASGPTQSFTSSKAQDLVAQCVQFAWQDEGVFGVDAAAYLESGYKGGSTVTTRGSEFFADVRSEGQGTLVEYYATSDKAIGPRRLAALATCL